MTTATGKIELVCPAGSLPALKAAVDNGADCVYLGYRDGTNARNFPGLGFDTAELARGIDYARDADVKVYVAINTYPRPQQWDQWCRAVDRTADHNVDALILADPGLMHYASSKHPGLRLHLSVQGSATNPHAIDFYVRHYAIQRVVLPRVLSLAQVESVISNVDIEVEVFGFGSLCVMVEGRCTLSSYVTGKSPNMRGVCSPASHVRYVEAGTTLVSKLGDFTINRVSMGEPAGYPTLCKGRFQALGKTSYLFEEPASLDIAAMLPQLAAAGVTALKIEGRQRGKAYVAAVVHHFRQAVDALDEGREIDISALTQLAEGGRSTAGAYRKAWQ